MISTVKERGELSLWKSFEGEPLKTQKQKLNHTHDESPRDSQVLPFFLLYITNAVFFGLFFSVAYFLLHRWRGKIRTSTPLHVVTASKTAAIISLVASFVYLLGFFGIGFVQPIGSCAFSSNDKLSDDEIIAKEDSKNPGPCPAALTDSCPPKAVSVSPQLPLENILITLTQEDEEIVKSVISGSISSYSLESRLGECRRAAAIRREVDKRLASRSLDWESLMLLLGFE